MHQLSTNATQTMSSLDIATLTGKGHHNVLRDIKQILDDAEIGALKFEGTYKSARPDYPQK